MSAIAANMSSVGRSPSSTIAITTLYGTAMAWMVAARGAPMAAIPR